MQGLTEVQRINAILILEGMPPELPLLADSPDFEPLEEVTDIETAHQQVQAALSLDEATPVDVFMEAQAIRSSEDAYRYADDRDIDKEREAINIAKRATRNK